MGLFNWLWAGRRRGSNPPSPGNKPKPPAGPPESWVDPAKEKRSAELAEQLGLSPQDWAEKYSKPQPPGGRLFVNGIEQPRPARREQGFDVERLADRLDKLANFVTQGPEAVRRNFTMRVPVEPYHDADLVMSAAASLLRNRPAANHGSLLSLETDFQCWYKSKYGQPYFRAIPIIVAIEWVQHLLQQHTPPGESPSFRSPAKYVRTSCHDRTPQRLLHSPPRCWRAIQPSNWTWPILACGVSRGTYHQHHYGALCLRPPTLT